MEEILKNSNKKLIAGIGSALVDILVKEDDEFVTESGAAKGGMTYVDSALIDRLMKDAGSEPSVVPGGSACNTIMGVGKLGGSARFIGKLGKDDLGSLFENRLQESNVEPVLFHSASPTGRVLSIITPDAQRSMLTYLGASAEIGPGEVTEQCFENAAIVHVEGYLLFSGELIIAAMEAAKKAGALVSLDLASYTVVEASKNLLDSILDKYVDIILANEDEAKALTGYDDEARAVGVLSEKAGIAVVKIGERGSYLARKGGEIIRVEPFGDGGIIDTTGAGDLWASGFLFGLVNGYPLEKCGDFGSICGYEVCRVVGTDIPEKTWTGIGKLLETF